MTYFYTIVAVILLFAAIALALADLPVVAISYLFAALLLGSTGLVGIKSR